MNVWSEISYNYVLVGDGHLVDVEADHGVDPVHTVIQLLTQSEKLMVFSRNIHCKILTERQAW